MKFWYKKSLFKFFLLPFSWIYLFIIIVRRFLYQMGFKKITKFSVPVIVVGNITVGGTGKTPLVIYLAKELKRQGFRPGIVSRGYGGRSKEWPQVVTKDSDPYQVGDEPVLIAQKTECLVVVAPNRVAAVKKLLAQKLLSENNCNIIISDDGLQHYALARDVEMVVIDGERGLGNGACLPAGPLREPSARLNKVNAIVINGKNNLSETFSKPVFEMHLMSEKIYSVVHPEKTISVEDLQNKTIHAVAAIGNPERFFNQLRKMGLTIIPHAFPDHYFFKPYDMDFGENAWVIMTEKDAVKCRLFADERLLCLSVGASLVDAQMEGHPQGTGHPQGAPLRGFIAQILQHV